MRGTTRRFALAAVLLALQIGAGAQAETGQAETASAPLPAATADPSAIEEIVVLGRFKSAATDIVSERIDSDVPIDLLDAEGIGRVGDGDVAQALRRLPGLALAHQFYVAAMADGLEDLGTHGLYQVLARMNGAAAE